MFAYIITPCSRPQNLHTIARSINLPRHEYEWIVVHDADELPSTDLLPDNAVHIAKRVHGSTVGHGQRNVALDLIRESYSKEKSDYWIYFNDDDTVIHSDLFETIRQHSDADFIHFMQNKKDGTQNLRGYLVMVNHIDSHNFIFRAKLLGDTNWIINQYNADGYFAQNIYKKAQHPLYIPQVLSVYNALR